MAPSVSAPRRANRSAAVRVRPGVGSLATAVMIDARNWPIAAADATPWPTASPTIAAIRPWPASSTWNQSPPISMLVAGTYRAAASNHAGVGGSTDSSRFCNVRRDVAVAFVQGGTFECTRAPRPERHQHRQLLRGQQPILGGDQHDGARRSIHDLQWDTDDHAGAGSADQAGHQLARGNCLPCRGQLDRGKVRFVGSDGLFAHQLVVAVDEEHGAGDRTDPGSSVDERGAHHLIASRDRCDAPTDLLERVERSSTAGLPFEQNRGVERGSHPWWRDRR